MVTNSQDPRIMLRNKNQANMSVNRSVASSSHRGSEKRISRKRFRDDGEVPGLKIRTALTQGNKRISTENSDRSQSIFEEMSLGGEVDPKDYDERSKNRLRQRSIARKQAAI